MKKIKDFVMKHYVVLIPICLIIVLILTYAIYSIQKLYDNYSKTIEEDGYTFFAGTKVDDKFKIKVNRKDEIIDITASKKMDINNIVYSSKSNKVIFPKEMTILFVYDNYNQYKVPMFSSLTYDSANTSYKLKTNDYDKEVSNFVLYDGTDLYFFAESSILDINGKKINLSPMSYVIMNNNNSVEYYDKESDKNEVIEINNNKVYVSNNAYKIDLGQDKAIRYDKFVLLNKPSFLDNIK